MDNIKYSNTIDTNNIGRRSKIIKTRDVISKLIHNYEHLVVVDDDGVNNMIEDLMSKDIVDKEGNKHKFTSISSGNTIVRTIDNELEKFEEVMKNIPHQKLQEIKEKIRDAIQKDPLLNNNLDDAGIDLDNLENYLGSVEVLTIERRRIFNIYEVKDAKNE